MRTKFADVAGWTGEPGNNVAALSGPRASRQTEVIRSVAQLIECVSRYATGTSGFELDDQLYRVSSRWDGHAEAVIVTLASLVLEHVPSDAVDSWAQGQRDSVTRQARQASEDKGAPKWARERFETLDRVHLLLEVAAAYSAAPRGANAAESALLDDLLHDMASFPELSIGSEVVMSHLCGLILNTLSDDEISLWIHGRFNALQAIHMSATPSTANE